MTACPPADRLSALLAGTLPDDTASTLDDHLAGCPDCQTRLDQLTDSPQLAAWLDGHLVGRAEHPYLAPPARPGDLGRVGRFHVEAEVGRGEMGVVFRGWDPDLGRMVALKVLRADRADEHAVARFAREAQAGGRLRHDHLVPVLGLEYTPDGRAVLVLPFVAGPSLKDRLRADPPLTPREAAEVARQVADGLAAAHTAGLVHRDVKPSNVLLDPADGRAKLTDFGLARPTAAGETLTQDGLIVGTPEYLSPEQADDPARADPRADVYSLGVTLYECLTGVVPFRGRPFEVIARHAAEEPVPPRRLTAAVPADLETICLKCLEKTPARRYATAAEVRDDLARWLAGRPILARPVGPVGRGGRWVRRNPLPVAVVVVSVVGFAASATGWWQAGVKAEEADRSATAAKDREADATAARQLADEKARLADERSQLALGAVNTLITKAQALADNAPGTLALKQQLSEAALADLRQLSASVARVPGADRSAVQAHLKLGEALNLLGRSDDAFREWELARAAADVLVAADPDDPDDRRFLARAHYLTGFHQNRLTQYPAAGRNLTAAVTTLEEAARRHPADRQVGDALAIAYTGRAETAFYQNQTATALADYERALALRLELVGRFPDDQGIAAGLPVAYGKVGYIHLYQLHDYPAAERHFRESMRLADEQRTQAPDDRSRQRVYRLTLLDLSSARHRQGDFAEAERLARAALDWLGPAAAAEPDNGQAQRDLMIGWDHLALAQLGAERPDDAARSYDQSLQALDRAVRSSSVAAFDRPMLFFKLAVVAARRERYTEAAGWMERVADARRQLAVGKTLQGAQGIANALVARDAYRAAAVATAEPKVAYAQKPAVAVCVGGIQALALARRGELAAARALAANVREQYKSNLASVLYQTLVLGAVAARTTDPAEKQTAVAEGAAALVSVLRVDPGLIGILYVFPEFAPLRTNPLVLAQLRPRPAGPN